MLDADAKESRSISRQTEENPKEEDLPIPSVSPERPVLKPVPGAKERAIRIW
jgi:hypothetical protein